MNVSNETIERAASLARLELTPAERDRLTRDLQAILSYVEQLTTLDTTGIPPTAHAAALSTPLRDDIPRIASDATREALLRASPDRRGDLFGVPKVKE